MNVSGVRQYRPMFADGCWRVLVPVPYVCDYDGRLAETSALPLLPITDDDGNFLVDRERDYDAALRLAPSILRKYDAIFAKTLPPFGDRTDATVQEAIERVVAGAERREPGRTAATRLVPARDCTACGATFRHASRMVKMCDGCRAERDRQLQTRRDAALPTVLVGAIGELRAAVALMSVGYYVFRSLTPQCPCDLVAFVRGSDRPLRVEVKSHATDLSAARVTFEQHGGEAEYDILAVVGPARVRLLHAGGQEQVVEVRENAADAMAAGIADSSTQADA